jgi:hypothetical protein
MATDTQELWARFEQLEELPYGTERTEAHLALSAEAETSDDWSLRCRLLIWISDDHMETGDRARMAEYFDRAWALFRAHREQVDPRVRYNLRTTFAPTIDFLDSSPDIPAEVVLARLGELDAFYREYGYSMRIPHRARYWFHRRRGEQAAATEQIELLIAAPGDAGANCDAMGPVVGAQWFQGAGDDRERAAQLWRSVLMMRDQRCREDHRAQAYAELMHLAVGDDRGAEARRCHRDGYPLIRRAEGQWRSLDLHMIYTMRARDVAGFVQIVHDHLELLDLPLDDDVAWYQGRVLQFLHLLGARGHNALPFTLADRSETTAAQLRVRLEAALEAHAAGQRDERDRALYTERLEKFRSRVLEKLELPAEESGDDEQYAALPPVPAPWAAPPDLEDLPKGWSTRDALLAQARVLAYLEHPHAEGAWAAVAALGTPPNPADQARLAEYRSDVLVREGEHLAGRTMRLLAADLYEQAGRPNRALLNRAFAALAAYLAKEPDTALAERDAVVAEARARHADGLMEDGELLEILVEDFRLNSVIEIIAYGSDRNGALDNTETNAKFTAATELYLQRRDAHAACAGLVDAWGFYRQQMARLYDRYGVFPDVVRETMSRVDFWYAKARDEYRDAMLFPQESERELARGGNLLDAELYEEAERAAVEALRLAGGLGPKERGRIRLLQAQAIAGRLGAAADRDGELMDAAREANALLSGEDENAAAAARVLMADVHRRAGRMETALAVYDEAVRCLADGWGERTDRPVLRRATAGRVVCLRALERESEAQALLDRLAEDLPEWNRITLGWIRHDLGRAYQLLGAESRSVAEYAEAVRISQQEQELEPHCSALLHLSELVAPTDPPQALDLVDDAVALIDRFIEAELAQQAERAERRAARAAERGEQPGPRDEPSPDPLKLARRATAQASKIRLLIEPEPAPDEVLECLLPAAYGAADEGVRGLADLVRAADEDDPRRSALMAALESAVGWAATVQGGMGDDAGAAARFTAFAELAEECGFPGHARTARGNAQAMNPRPEDGADEDAARRAAEQPA